MTTETALLSRVRLEIGDQLEPFQSTAFGDGETRRFELPSSPISLAGFSAFLLNPQTNESTPLLPSTYTLDAANGVITLPTAPLQGRQLVIMGTSARYFDDETMLVFVRTALTQHLHNRDGINLGNMPPVEEYPVALLAAVEALYALMNDAAFDIDVSTPEGVGIPRSQRFRQLQEMIELRKAQYAELCAALNVGLNRIEMFDLRRVSRTTGRLVPIYESREIEDIRGPRRVFPPIDGLGGTRIPSAQEPATYDIRFRQRNTFTLPLDFSFDMTGYTVFAAIRRYPDGARLREFNIAYTDRALGKLTLSLDADDTRILPLELFWTLDLLEPNGNEVTYMKGRVEVDRARAAIIQSYG